MLTFNGEKVVIDGILKKDSSVKVYNFTVSDFHTYFVSELGILVHNDCFFKWQKNKGMNDILGKSIHGDVYNKKGIRIGEVGFELENGAIVPKALGKNLTNSDIKYIETVGATQLKSADFKKELLGKVDEALNSGQLPVGSNRVQKLHEMKTILTPPTAQK